MSGRILGGGGALLTALLLMAGTLHAQGSPMASPARDSALGSGLVLGLRQPPPLPVTLPQDTVKRARVSAFSDGYISRLKIHRIASFASYPIMGAEYLLGNSILNSERDSIEPASGTKSAHSAVATALVGLFAVNSVLGVWNWLEARHTPEGRFRRTIHGIAMIIADAGFAYTASLGGGAKLRRSNGNLAITLDNANKHKNAAIFSISVATVGSVMMWLWRD